MTVVAGVLGVNVDGVSFATSDSAKYNAATREAAEVACGSGFAGIETKGVCPYIEVTVFLSTGQVSTDVVVRGGTVILICEDRTVTLSNAHHVGKTEPDAGKNSLSAKWVGSSCTEILNG